jgi:hypothetical protein
MAGDGVRRGDGGRGGMQRGARWGSCVTRDGVHGREDGNNERTIQQHVMGESDGGIFLREIGR